ncbi:acyl-CoA dehydrogenase family protein [Actinomadura sp. WAC 06369]|uniref:acyl-CoA dehydrogenase family protein n=1 Tax=Actinomadura sp. WAC 06369 TaxID=2203193 RepID=UPI000F7811BE|nr:acyl-CoA dehydrogenase family protein [Actinomadura sp. WAC 06369]RSN64363.1 acyl-CoA dehydrogenase [Actinomadura sp. WAC 06369]
MISEEQEALAAAVREWLAARTDLAAARAAGDGAPPARPADLREAAALGLVGLLRDEGDGEGGGTYADLALVVEELGRAASPLPLGQAALACRALDGAGIGGDAAGRAAAGEVLVVPVLPEPGEEPVRASSGPEGALVLDGRVAVAVGARDAGFLLAAATGPDGAPVLALTGADAPGVVRTARAALDITRDFAAVALDGARVPAGSWSPVDAGTVEVLAAASALHHAADALGAADRLLAMTLRYVRERRQFGRAIGSFQAVKHHCADMAVDVERARACVRAGARALDAGEPGARRVAIAEAAAVAGEACSRVAGTALQLHGGMGFTWEHDLHLYLRRVKTGELLGGTPRYHYARLMDLVA